MFLSRNVFYICPEYIYIRPSQYSLIAVIMITVSMFLTPPPSAQPEVALYLAPVKPLLRQLRCRLFSVGVGEEWAAIILDGVAHEGKVSRPPIPLLAPTT